MEKLLQWQFYSELWEEVVIVVILSYWCNLYGDLWVNLEGLRMKKKVGNMCLWAVVLIFLVMDICFILGKLYFVFHVENGRN